MALYHFSEDPTIARFEPHVPAHRFDVEPLVWAIDEWHSAMYFVSGPARGRAPRTTICGSVMSRRGWWWRSNRVGSNACETPRSIATCFRSKASCYAGETAGHWVSREPVEPTKVEPLSDLLGALAAADVELRLTPRLVELWHRVVATTLDYSGTRLKNVQDWREPPAR